MSTDKIVGLTHHTIIHDDASRTKNFSLIHCYITIIGNWNDSRGANGELDQFWWNVTPDHMFMPATGTRQIHWHLNLLGIVSGQAQGSKWDPTQCGWGVKGVEFPGVTNGPHFNPSDNTYRWTVPASWSEEASHKYNIYFKVGDVNHKCDPELEIGQED